MKYNKHKAHNFIISVSISVYLFLIFLEGKYDFTTILVLSTLVIYFLGYLVYSIYSKIQSERNEKENKRKLIDFKSNAIKINVDLKNVKIKSNSYTNKQTLYKYQIYEEVIETDVSTNYVELKVKFENKVIDCSFHISMDKKELEFKMGTQKTTELYIDRNNSDNYYLDLEFLKLFKH